ncbi:MAG TPA: TrmH family RNA methyltransferase [Polyangiaceae bacterium]
MASVFLYAPQSFHNLCLMARTLEVFGELECPVFDPNGLIRERYGKVRSREMRAVSAGAFEKIQWLRIEDPLRFLAEHCGRIVATVADATAISLGEHRFEQTDLVLFGSETLGLPARVVAESSTAITIPNRGITRSLNLAVSLGIVLFERQRQLEIEGAP